MKGNTRPTAIPDATEVSVEVVAELTGYVGPLLVLLDQLLDARLVRTFAATVVNMIRHRDRAMSLILTELGELLTDGAHAPAGVKRLGRLLASRKWVAKLISEWLLRDADQAVEAAVAKDGAAFLVLDGSGIEKPCARKLEGLTKIRSTKASLLQRACGGPPPKRPVVVPGFNWAAAIVTGFTGTLTLARLLWYSPKAPGEAAQRQREGEWAVLGPLLERWGRKVVCLLDRGFGDHPFVSGLLESAARFVVRVKPDLLLVGVGAEAKSASQLSRRVRSQWAIQIFDARTHQWIQVGVAAMPVKLPGYEVPLWLVVVRRKQRRAWWFLTSEEAGAEEGAMWVMRAYARRWQVEWAFRQGKAELGMESIRIRSWQYREKLWAMAELVHAFLLRLIVLDRNLLARVLRWCHRTGRRWTQVIAPIYRLRHALANLWNPHPPTLAWLQ